MHCFPPPDISDPVAQRIRHLSDYRSGDCRFESCQSQGGTFISQIRRDTLSTIAKALSTNYTQTYFTLKISVESHCRCELTIGKDDIITPICCITLRKKQRYNNRSTGSNLRGGFQFQHRLYQKLEKINMHPRVGSNHQPFG